MDPQASPHAGHSQPPDDSAASSEDGYPRMRSLECRLDSALDEEAYHVRGIHPQQGLPSLLTLQFVFQSLGVVYGDLSTSPLYVYPSTFPDGIQHEDDLLGVLSLIIYTLIFIPLIKYTLIVMKANDNGEGGTFALYSLICRQVKVNTIPNQHPTDLDLTTYSRMKLEEKSVARKTKKWLESNNYSQKLLLILVLLGTCMLIGDGILTPAISVLSSVSGITDKSEELVVSISVGILIGVFSLQKFGTDKVAWAFAPIVLLWLLAIGSVGVYNIFKHDQSVFRAFSPYYIVHYFSRRKIKGWLSLGGIVLSITGAEAMYADIGHFSAFPVQIAFTVIVFPCLVMSYMGQAAYLVQFPNDVNRAFYHSIPDPVYWPVFIVATMAAVIGSQSTITATFSVVKQSLALGCFPRVKVVHTSQKIAGQIYIPEVNWILMFLCVAITAGFRDTAKIGNAYGIAVVTLMLVTTLLSALVMLLIWRSNVFMVGIFVAVFLSLEVGYFSAVISKVGDGGWVPIVIAGIFLLIMYSWHYGTLKKYQFEMQSKVSLAWILGLGPSLGLVRVPGIGLVYTELAHGVPSIFSHFVTHIPAIHSVLIFVCVKYLPVNTVRQEERFLFKRIGPKEYSMYRCVVRYGYKDLHKKDDKFEHNLFQHLTHLIKTNAFCDYNTESSGRAEEEDGGLVGSGSSPQIVFDQDQQSSANIFSVPEAAPDTMRLEYPDTAMEDSLQVLESAREAGIVHIIGDISVKASRGSNVFKKLAIDYAFALMGRLCRENSAVLHIPHESLFSLGQVYYV